MSKKKTIQEALPDWQYMRNRSQVARGEALINFRRRSTVPLAGNRKHQLEMYIAEFKQCPEYLALAGLEAQLKQNRERHEAAERAIAITKVKVSRGEVDVSAVADARDTAERLKRVVDDCKEARDSAWITAEIAYGKFTSARSTDEMGDASPNLAKAIDNLEQAISQSLNELYAAQQQYSLAGTQFPEAEKVLGKEPADRGDEQESTTSNPLTGLRADSFKLQPPRYISTGAPTERIIYDQAGFEPKPHVSTVQPEPQEVE